MDKKKEDKDQEKSSDDVILGNEVTPESEDEAENTEQEELVQKVADLEEQAKRFLADYQNLQRRVQEEKSDWIRTANKDLILKLLDVWDTLNLAQKHLQDQGLGLSIQKFTEVLSKEGVIPYITLGLEYDPTLMNVVSTQKVEEKKKGRVIEEIQLGFKQYDKVIRVANVIIGE